MPKEAQKKQDIFFGTKEFKNFYSVGTSTQAFWRKNGLPYYRIPNSTKIMYKEDEVLAWITSQKGDQEMPDKNNISERS